MTTATGIGPRGLCIATLTAALISVPGQATAKTPGKTYCFLSTCHRVLTLAETRAAIGKPRPMHASHYDAPSRDRFNPSLITSSGELFRPDAPNNAASPIYPDGTLVAVFAPGTKRGAIVRINNAGPYWGNRLIDLSRGLAEKLGIAKSGVGRVVVEVLAAPSKAEATYVRGRRYASVPGFLGKVASLESVRETWGDRSGPRSVTVAVAQPARPAAPAVSTTVALAGPLAPAISPDDMRTSSATLQAVTAPSQTPLNGKRQSPARQASQSRPSPRQAQVKAPALPFR